MGILCLLLSLPKIANAQVFATSGFKPVPGTNKVIGFCSTSAVLDGVTSAAGTKNAHGAYPYSGFYDYCDVTGWWKYLLSEGVPIRLCSMSS
jgi:hypothetical protein